MANDNPYALGVCFKNKEVFLFYLPPNPQAHSFQIASSKNGLHFMEDPKNATISNEGENVKPQTYQDFNIAELENGYVLSYKIASETNPYLFTAFSEDLLTWKSLGKISNIKEAGIVASNYKYNDNYLMYFGEKTVKVAFSKDLKVWEIAKRPALEPRKGHFDSTSLRIGGVIPMKRCILVIYYVKKRVGKSSRYTVGAATFHRDDPQILLWRSNDPFWEQPQAWDNKEVKPLGIIHRDGKLVFYWKVDQELHAISCFPPVHVADSKDKVVSLILKKYGKNPIIEPHPHHHWESKATFNSAAVYEDGKVHFLYRAIGDKDISVLGYATSQDGVNIDNRLNEPAFVPTQPFECCHQKPPYFPSSYMSGGGGYGGCEDPRITKIDDRVYMTYVAFDGWSPPRVAITSIALDDFLNHRWDWETPKLISRPGVVDKNACILPEKINGKYVVFHRIFPNVLIDFVDDLEFKDYLKDEFAIEPREGYWDSLKIGVGPPPVKTDEGWLTIYQAVGYQDYSRYKIGAMLLDLNDPTKVICRSNNPILEPTEHYENEGHKSGVAYPCGAALIKDQLFVYYGGADKVVCAAKQNVNTLLHELKSSHSVHLEPVTNQLKVDWLQ